MFRHEAFRATAIMVTVILVASILYGVTNPSLPAQAQPFIRTTVAPISPAMQKAVTQFLDSLSPELRQKALFPFDAEERLNWHFVPKSREGVRFDALDAKQKEKALALLKECLSASGYKKIEAIRALEDVLYILEGRTDHTFRNTEHYYITIFGTPTDKGTWGLRYEGHHVSLHWTVVEGVMIASTPQFLGVNPAKVHLDGPHKGKRVLSAEEDLARTLLLALTDEQKQVAILSADAPDDILTSAQRTATMQEDKGIAYKALTEKQKALLIALITEYTKVQKEAVAKERLARIRRAGLDNIRFAWMGSEEPGKRHYYRVQGPTFLIEYDNTQNEANHIHCVWRDFKGDFGRDVLAQHYQNAHHSDTPSDTDAEKHPGK
jgi:hypothetical protein